MLKYSKYIALAIVLLWSAQFTSALALSFNPYPTGTLVNDSGTIYFISGSDKVPFTNWQAFSGLGYSLQNVVQGDLTNYPLVPGYTINTANAAHPWGSWLIYQGTVYYSTQGGLIGVPSAAVFTSNGGDWQYIVRANQWDVVLLNENPNLPVLQMNDPRVGGSTYGGGTTTGTLTVSTNSVSLTASVGQTSAVSQYISVNPGSSTTYWTAQVQTYGIQNLNIGYNGAVGASVSGTGPASVLVEALPSFNTGTQSSTILVSSNGQTQSVYVTLTVSGSTTGALQVSPTSLAFTAVAGGSVPSTQSLYINPGSSTAPWTAQVPPAQVLGVNLAYGNNYGSLVTGTGPATISVSISGSGSLAQGTYTSSILVSSSVVAGGQAQTVPVSFTVIGQGGGSAPVIYSVSPTTAAIGTQVEIYGNGFSNTANTIEIDGLVAANYNAQPLPEVNGQAMSFAIPSSLSPYCTTGQACPQYVEQLQPGTHSLSVISNGVQSNSVSITVTASGSGTVGGINTTSAVAISASASSGTLTITATSGTSFTPTENQVYVDGLYVQTVSSANGQTISVTLQPGTASGSHTVVVQNANGTSNTAYFNI